jgi:hypothetical protein
MHGEWACPGRKPGSKGGKETVRRHGWLYMKEIAKRGIRATANRDLPGKVDIPKKSARVILVLLSGVPILVGHRANKAGPLES